MDENGRLKPLNMRHWGYIEQPLKRSLGLDLMSNMAAERDTKPLLSNLGFFHRNWGVPEPSVKMDFVRDGWTHHSRGGEFSRAPTNHQGMNHQGYGVLSEACGAHTIRMLQPPNIPKPKEEKMMQPPNIPKPKEEKMLQPPNIPKPKEEKMLQPPTIPKPKEEKIPQFDVSNGLNDAPSKKRPRTRPIKSPKEKKPKKVNNQAREVAKKKSTDVVINGIDLDLSGIPPPVCSCTGNPQQCYRWGIGGWQSACCTISISVHPLPMSTKRRGARIAGRKMSQGAFKKVVEKLAGEGHNLSIPIDLKTFWAKHGTNKFVTIR